MRRLLASTVLALALPLTAHAQAFCPLGTLQDYINLGATGCRVGNEAYNNFGLQIQGNTAAFPGVVSPTNPAQIFLTPEFTILNGWEISGFSVTGPFYLALGSSGNKAVSLNVLFQFASLDPTRTREGLFAGYRSAVLGGDAGGGAGLQTWVTGNALVGDAASVDFGSIDGVVQKNEVPPLHSGSAFAGLDLVSGTAGDVRVESFRFGFLLSVTAAPEPTSLALMATGLVAVGAMVRRTRRVPS